MVAFRQNRVVPGWSARGANENSSGALASRVFDLILTDLRLGGRRDGGLQVMAAAGILSPRS